MAKITYKGESENVSWYGQAFAKGKAVTTDNATLIAAAEKNPLFAVSKGKASEVDEEDDAEADKASAGGAKAKEAGKPRNVPPAYRGKSEEERWLKAYDDAKAPDDGSDDE